MSFQLETERYILKIAYIAKSLRLIGAKNVLLAKHAAHSMKVAILTSGSGRAIIPKLTLPTAARQYRPESGSGTV